MVVAYSRPPEVIIRHALCDAIDATTSYLDAIRDSFIDPVPHELLLSDYRRMLRLRYGTDRTPLEKVGDGLKSIDIETVMINVKG